MSAAIPVVDFSLIAVGRPDAEITDEDRLQVGQALMAAFTDIGFCYMEKHGVPEALRKECLDAARGYFALPIDVKKRMLRVDPMTQYCGWLPSPETKGAESLEFKPEQFDITKPPDIKETFNIHRASPDDLFPSQEELPGFKDATIRIIEQLDILLRRCLQALGHALKLDDPNALLELMKRQGTLENDSIFRYAFYPKVESEIPEGQLRCFEHTDFGFMTFLFQNETPGLQVFTRDEKFVDVAPREGTFLVNIADSLERMTGGVLRSAKHRVMLDEETGKSDRYSVIYFLSADRDALLHALCGDQEKYGEKLTSGEFIQRRAKDIFERGKGITTHTSA